MFKAMKKSSDLPKDTLEKHLKTLGLPYPKSTMKCPTTNESHTPKIQAIMQLATVFSEMPVPMTLKF